MRPLYLLPAERVCLDRMKVLPDLSEIRSERLDDGELFITGKHHVWKSRIALFVVPKVQSPADLDDLYDWAISEVTDQWTSKQELGPIWNIGLACPEDNISDESIAHYHKQGWSLDLVLVPQELMIEAEKPVNNALSGVLDMLTQASDAQPNPVLDAAIQGLKQMMVNANQPAKPTGGILTIGAKSVS